MHWAMWPSCHPTDADRILKWGRAKWRPKWSIMLITSNKDSLLDQTLVRLLWALFSNRPPFSPCPVFVLPSPVLAKVLLSQLKRISTFDIWSNSLSLTFDVWVLGLSSAKVLLHSFSKTTPYLWCLIFHPLDFLTLLIACKSSPVFNVFRVEPNLSLLSWESWYLPQ